MKITRHRDRRTVDLPEAEAKWLIDHGFATKAKSEPSKTDDGKRDVAEPAGSPSEESRRRGRRASSAGPHPA